MVIINYNNGTNTMLLSSKTMNFTKAEKGSDRELMLMLFDSSVDLQVCYIDIQIYGISSGCSHGKAQ